MQARDSVPYIGRFAPSPTGPLHFGSLVAAAASYLRARSQGGSWLLRIEDIDPPREQPGATERIIAALRRYGFEWDGDVIYQSGNDAAHRDAVDTLMDRGLAYRCRCSRKDLENARRGPLGIVYPGTCRNGCDDGEAAIRLRTDDTDITFTDGLQGKVIQRLASESGDFIIRRRDGLIAYHLAVVVDDHLQGVTEVVRGIDLLDSTPRQIYLQQLLGYQTPAYAHIPVVTHPNGDKLSKATAAPEVPLESTTRTLCNAFEVLGLSVPAEMATAPLPEIWNWANKTWQMEKLLGQKSIIDSA